MRLWNNLGNPPQSSASFWSLEKAVTALLLAVAAILTALYLLRPIADPDFFWHLRMGRWIWDLGTLPVQDPFNATSPNPLAAGGRFILTSYWLIQLLFHGAHAAAGLTGIAILRALFFGGMVAALATRMKGDRALALTLYLLGAVSLLQVYPMERPQVASFGFMAALLVLLEDPESRERPGLLFRSVAVPVLMVLWSNTHGAFVLGQATLLVALALEALRPLPVLPAVLRAKPNMGIVLSACLGLAASFLNPNGLAAVKIALSHVEAPAGTLNTEYLSMLKVLAVCGDYTVLVDLFLMALAVVAVAWGGILRSPLRASVALGMGGAALFTNRHFPFFLVAALPLIFDLLKKPAIRRWILLPLVPLTLGVVGYFGVGERENPSRLFRKGWIDLASYPVGAADFIAGNGLRGTLYNPYDWGGYLIWRLGPDCRVLLDGRGLGPLTTNDDAMISLGLQPDGPTGWRTLFARYGVTMALTPLRLPGGYPSPMPSTLMADPNWRLVWADPQAALFLRVPGRPG